MKRSINSFFLLLVLQKLLFPFVLCYFACSSVSGLFEKVFQNRYALEPHAGSRCVVPFSQAFDSIEKRFESAYYDAEEGFYGLGSKNGRQFWQTGWVGGGIAGYPLLCKGNRNSQKHAESTLQFIFSKLQNLIKMFSLHELFFLQR